MHYDIDKGDFDSVSDNLVWLNRLERLDEYQSADSDLTDNDLLDEREAINECKNELISWARKWMDPEEVDEEINTHLFAIDTQYIRAKQHLANEKEQLEYRIDIFRRFNDEKLIPQQLLAPLSEDDKTLHKQAPNLNMKPIERNVR